MLAIDIIFDKNTKLNKLGVCITFYYSVFLCLYPKFRCVHFLFMLFHPPPSFESWFCTWWLWGYFLGQSSDTTLLMFWCDTKFKTYFAIGITTDQLFLETRFLINIKFDLDLWYFLASIAWYNKKTKKTSTYQDVC